MNVRVQKAMGIFALTLAAGTSLGAEGKIRVAVFDFNTDAIRGSWHYTWSWADLERAAADDLVKELVKSGKFSVIERQQLDKILAEQSLGASGAVDAKTAARMGKILGVPLMITGSITDFGVSEWGGRIPQVGNWKWGSGMSAKVFRGKASLSARLVDTTTAEILAAYEASGDKQFAAAGFAGAEFGKRFDTGMVSKVLAEAVGKLAKNITKKTSALALPSDALIEKTLEGKIAQIFDAKIYLNLGTSQGVRLGDVFEVFRPGVEIRDPDTGEVLDVEARKIGEITVSEVKGKVSVASAADASAYQIGDVVKKKP